MAGFYERRIFPWLNDKLTADPMFQALRREALAPARGRVAEVGFGTGSNLPFYPEGVTSIVALEPNPGMIDRAKDRIAAASVSVEVVEGFGERIPLEDGSCDTAVLILTLCSVADPARVLSEIRRLLRSDGRLLLLEHGLSEEAGVARWQQRLNGLQNVLACGCNLNRPITSLVEGSGFRFESVRKFFAPKIPRTHGWVTLGVAAR